MAHPLSFALSEVYSHNLNQMKKIDSMVEQLHLTVTHVVVYEFKCGKWDSLDCAGPLFLVSNSASPCYSIKVLNQKTHKDISIPLGFDVKFSETAKLCCIHSNERVYGVWVHDCEEREKVVDAMKLIVKCSKSKGKNVLPPEFSDEKMENDLSNDEITSSDDTSNRIGIRIDTKLLFSTPVTHHAHVHHPPAPRIPFHPQHNVPYRPMAFFRPLVPQNPVKMQYTMRPIPKNLYRPDSTTPEPSISHAPSQPRFFTLDQIQSALRC